MVFSIITKFWQLTSCLGLEHGIFNYNKILAANKLPLYLKEQDDL